MNQEREKKILEILLREKEVTVKKLATALYISEPSIRRDLASLEHQQLLRRVHGGAMLEETNLSSMKIPFAIREMEQHHAKMVMAQKAISLVHDGDVIMLDASSSSYYLIPFLSRFAQITVITSGIRSLTALAEHSIPAYSTGGQLLGSCLSLYGEEAHRTISHFNANIVFFSCRGLTLDGRATDFSIEEDLVRQKMMDFSKKKVLLCDCKKIGSEYLHNLCCTDEIDFVVSEASVPGALFQDKLL